MTEHPHTERPDGSDRSPGHESPGQEHSAARGAGRAVVRSGVDWPRIRRGTVVLVALAVLVLFAVLTSRYSRRPSTESASTEPSLFGAPPLDPDRIERLAEEMLERQRRRSLPPPAPPDLQLEPPERLAPLPPPGPVAPSRSAQASSPGALTFVHGGGARAIESPLVPAGAPGRSPTAPAAASRSGSGGAPPSDLGRLRERLERAFGSRGADELGSSARSALPEDLSVGQGGRSTDAPAPSSRSGVSAEPVRVSFDPRPAGRTLAAGTTVPLLLVHRLSTDVSGPVRAQVSRDVLDSTTGTRVLLPRGTRVLGSQSGQPGLGDARVVIRWTSLLLPDGRRITLPEQIAGDPDGSAGARGRVDHHWLARYGSAVALSLVGAGLQLSQPQRRTAVDGFAPSEGQIVAEQAGLELGRVSQEILRRNVDRPSTITLEPGQRLTLLVAQDLVFPR